MPRALTIEPRENISMLKRGCGLREICRSLHVSLGSVHNIQRVHVPDEKFGHRGRPHVLQQMHVDN